MIARVEKNLPFMNKGRWYEFFIESDGSEYTLSKKDIERAEINSTFLDLPEGFHVVDYTYDVNTSGGTATSQIAFGRQIRRKGDGSQGVAIPNVSVFDYMTLYVFGYNE